MTAPSSSRPPTILNRRLILEHSAIAIAVLTGFLYVHGLAYYRGFLTALGLQPALFPIGADALLAKGYEAYSLIGLQIMLVLGALTGALILVSLLLTRMQRTVGGRKLLAELMENDAQSTLAAHPWPWRQFAERAAFNFSVIFVVFLFIVATSGFAAGVGIGEAQKLRVACATPGVIPLINVAMGQVAPWMEFRNAQGEVVAQGCTITSNEAVIAILTEHSLVLLTINSIATATGTLWSERSPVP